MADIPQVLPKPELDLREVAGLRFFTDEKLFLQTGIRIAFTERWGGVSEGEFAQLNLGSHVGDRLEDVECNRERLLGSLGASGMPLLVPNQIHGDNVIVVSDSSAQTLDALQADIADGADGIIVSVPNVAALLCFADCVPVAIASPDGTFSIVHAGWRGVMARIVPKAVAQMSRIGDCDPSDFNIYIGPHIHSECFEVSSELRAKFACEFGEAAVRDERHVDLFAAICASLTDVGVLEERICDLRICTACDSSADGSGDFYSYRASKGVCGRHGAIGFRRL